MSFLKNLFGSTPAKRDKGYYVFHVKCNRCSEIIEGRVDLDNDPSVEFEDNQEVFHVRKGLIGSGRCFQQIDVEMKFNPNKELIEKDITGGTFVD